MACGSKKDIYMLKKYIFKHDILLKHYGIFWIQIKYKKYNLVDCIFDKWYNKYINWVRISIYKEQERGVKNKNISIKRT